ncbi:MAG: type II toxin-antitoxin system RelE/ParE family toxin [Acidobacteria bacterium]|nr:type II toxin-antitoxin system RelE/ParE family toxin [Acidobacteriota bacterium]
MEYRVSLTESAKGDIAHFKVQEQRIIVAGIIAHLKVDAEIRTRKKKPLRPNPIAPWELRIDKFRVFYSIEETDTVKVVAVGHKEHNELFIRGKKVQL